MEKLVNHQTKKSAEKYLRSKVRNGGARAPSEPFKVPVLTATNKKRTFFDFLYSHEPLAIVNRRGQTWGWWEKIYAVEDMIGKFKAEGHKYFIYIDSCDAMIWQAPTVELCEKALESADILFQHSNHGFPRPAIFKRRTVLGDKGPCAGAFIARTDAVRDYCKIMRDLEDKGCPWITSINNSSRRLAVRENRFDDQGAWHTLACLFPDRIRVDTEYKYLTKEIRPDFDEVL